MMTPISTILSRRDRYTIAALVGLMVVGGMLEVIGIGLIFPYITILQNPEKIAQTPSLDAIYHWSGAQSYRTFSILLGAGLAAVFLAKGLFTIAMSNFQLRFVYGLQARLGEALLKRYLSQPYTFFLTANSSVLIANLTRSVGEFCSGIVQAALMLTTELIVVCSLMLFLIYLSPVFSALAILFVAGLALLFARVVRTKVARYGKETDLRWKAMLRTANEGISSAKELQVLAREGFFVDLYGSESRQYVAAISRYSILSQLPRVSLETAAVLGMVVFSIVALLLGSFEQDLFAILAVFAFAIVRIVPSANRILQAWQAIGFNRPAIDVLAGALAGLPPAIGRVEAGQPGPTDYRLRKKLTICVNSFVYPTNPNFRLADINLTIRQGQTIALIGHSGSGKTTLVDLILGLFPDFDGEIEVDDRDIRQGISAWRQRIGYIPQTLYLRDDTIVRNVAFAVPDARIERDRVYKATTLAGLEKVIAAQPQGLDTVVGDRGIRLSGGERQRIGIARALYHDPDVLILDEATSALDNETERQIVDSILGLSPAKTIIVIAHRLSTVSRCDEIILMKDGRIIDRGSFDDIARRHQSFVNPASSPTAALV